VGGITIVSAILGVLVGGIVGYRISRPESGCDPEMPDVRL